MQRGEAFYGGGLCPVEDIYRTVIVSGLCGLVGTTHPGAVLLAVQIEALSAVARAGQRPLQEVSENIQSVFLTKHIMCLFLRNSITVCLFTKHIMDL